MKSIPGILLFLSFSMEASTSAVVDGSTIYRSSWLSLYCNVVEGSIHDGTLLRSKKSKHYS
jgi:hypothetical protein